jgi:hypothetical protein
MLPKNLKYQNRVESAPAKSLRTNIAPQSGTGTYGFGDTIIINIPTRSNLVLNPADSYLKFDVAFTIPTIANNAVRWDSAGAHSIIQRLRIFSGSNLLQDIDNYGLLAKMLFDLQVPSDAAYGKFNVLAGTRNDLNTQLPTITALSTTAADYTGAADTAAGVAAKLIAANGLIPSLNAWQTAISAANRQSLQVNSGESLTLPAANGGDTTSVTYCLNLISLLGTLSNQYFPLFACTSAPIRLELQLSPNALSTINAVNEAPSAMKITNCEYVANLIELSDVAMGMIQQSLNGQPLQYVVPDYRNYQFSVSGLAQNTTQQVQFPIPAKFSSLKSIFVTMRDKLATLNYFPHSTVKNGIASYYFRVGANVYPQKPPEKLPEMFSEVLKAIGCMSNLDHHPSIEKASYTLDVSTAATTSVLMTNASSGSFYLGIDLENYANSSNYKDSVFSGYNSNTEDTYCVINLTPAAATNLRLDAYALFDEVLVFENNTAFVRF